MRRGRPLSASCSAFSVFPLLLLLVSNHWHQRNRRITGVFSAEQRHSLDLFSAAKCAVHEEQHPSTRDNRSLGSPNHLTSPFLLARSPSPLALFTVYDCTPRFAFICTCTSTAMQTSLHFSSAGAQRFPPFSLFFTYVMSSMLAICILHLANQVPRRAGLLTGLGEVGWAGLGFLYRDFSCGPRKAF